MIPRSRGTSSCPDCSRNFLKIASSNEFLNSCEIIVRQTRPRDCSGRRGTGDDQRSSIARRLAGPGNGRLFENTMGSTSWQGGALSTPDDTGFASIANALPDFESRTANVEWVRLVNSLKRMSFQAKSRNPWHCRELHRGILRLRCDPLRMTERL